MAEPFFNVPLRQIHQEIQLEIIECRKRGLIRTATWLAEMKLGMDTKRIAREPQTPDEKEQFEREIKNRHLNGIDPKEINGYDLARSYFDIEEFERGAHFVSNAKSPVPQFLFYYSMYKSKEKKRNDSYTKKDIFTESGRTNEHLTELMEEMRIMYAKRKFDGYCLYLYGTILKKLDLNELAKEVLIESIHKVPTLWCSYVDLIPLLSNKAEILSVNLPDHWMKKVFIAHAHYKLLFYNKAVTLYTELTQNGFVNSTFIMAQLGKSFYFQKLLKPAIARFEILNDMDPFRVDDMDIHSNLLYINDNKKKLAQLATKTTKINKYHPESYCVVANYYSIRKDHTKAIVYFQRAIRKDPSYLAAWVLMGHEFGELKNTKAALHSYHRATELNRREYRAWFGLGKTYEVLNLIPHCMQYYKFAVELWPYESRMLIALGENYEKIKQSSNALKCFQKAHSNGDMEGATLIQLAKLYEKDNNMEAAVPIYMEYCKDKKNKDIKVLSSVYMSLGHFYEKVNKLDQAKEYAYKCLEYENTKTDARTLLNTIKNKRGQMSPLPLDLEPIEDQLGIIEEASNLSEPSTSNAFQPGMFFNQGRPLYFPEDKGRFTMEMEMSGFGKTEEEEGECSMNIEAKVHVRPNFEADSDDSN